MTNRNSACVLAALMTSVLGSICSFAQGNGAISGTVVDENGVPVSEAKVNAEPEDRRPGSLLLHYVETDSGGHFMISRLAWGKYKLFAKKDDSGYPDMRWSFYSDDIFPTATVTPTAPDVEVQIQLAPKAAVLTGSIANALTGAPLNAGLKLTRAVPPHKWISTSVPPNYRVLLPPSSDILLEVSAPGFRTWTPGHPLRLAPGAELRMDISLEPSHDPDLHPSWFLVPEGYVGWLLLEYNVKDAQPAPEKNEIKTFKFPANGVLNTSSAGPQRGAEDHYFYYSPDGSLREIPTDYRNGKGMIWGQHEGAKNGVFTQFGFFVGIEEQYRKLQTQATHPGPIPLQQREAKGPQ